LHKDLPGLINLPNFVPKIFMEFIQTYNLTGFIIGIGTFLIIGICHPIVIKSEYYFGVKCWWAFLLLGIAGIVFTFLFHNIIISTLCGVIGFSFLWGIKELFEQQKRVEKGWFPKRNKNK
jgi:branched-subunit amino acid transport protein